MWGRLGEGNIFYVHPYLGKISILTHIFQMGWFNHQPVMLHVIPGFSFERCFPVDTWNSGMPFPTTRFGPVEVHLPLQLHGPQRWIFVTLVQRWLGPSIDGRWPRKGTNISHLLGGGPCLVIRRVVFVHDVVVDSTVGFVETSNVMQDMFFFGSIKNSEHFIDSDRCFFFRDYGLQ